MQFILFVMICCIKYKINMSFADNIILNQKWVRQQNHILDYNFKFNTDILTKHLQPFLLKPLNIKFKQLLNKQQCKVLCLSTSYYPSYLMSYKSTVLQ